MRLDIGHTSNNSINNSKYKWYLEVYFSLTLTVATKASSVARWSEGTSTSVSTWMSDHQRRQGAVILGQFVYSRYCADTDVNPTKYSLCSNKLIEQKFATLLQLTLVLLVVIISEETTNLFVAHAHVHQRPHASTCVHLCPLVWRDPNKSLF